MVSFIITLKRLLKGIFHAFKDQKFLVLFVLTAATLLSGTLFYTRVEGLHWIDALYFCAVTLTTVGHPDFVPSTGFGNAFHGHLYVRRHRPHLRHDCQNYSRYSISPQIADRREPGVVSGLFV